MPEPRYQLIVEAFDPSRRAALVALLSRLTHRSPDELVGWLDALPGAIGWDLDAQAAERLHRALERVGASVRLVAAHEGADGGGNAAAAGVLGVSLPPVPDRGEPEDGASGGGTRGGGTRGGGTPSGGAPLPQPLGLWRRLGWAFRMVWRNKARVLGLWALWAVASALVSASLTVVLPGVAWRSGGLDALLQQVTSPATGVAVALWALASLLLWSWLQAAMLMLPLRWFEAGASPPFADLVRDAWRRAPDVAGTVALVALPLVVVAVLPLAVSSPQHPSSAGLGLTLVALCVAVTLGLCMVLAVPVAANEALGPVRAFRRGWCLAAGRRLRIAGNGLAFAALAVLGFAAVQALLGLLAVGLGALAPLAVLAMPLVMVAAMLVFAGIMAAASLFLMALLYAEARVEGDGWRPPWRVLPHPQWPRGDSDERPEPASRGMPAWRDFALIGGTALAVAGAVAVWTARGWIEEVRGAAAGSVQLVARSPGSRGQDAGASVGRAARTGASGPVTAAAGTPELSLQLDTFFPSRQDPKIWVKVAARHLTAGLPMAVVPDDYVRVRIHAVRDAAGRNRYNAESPFEGPQFERLQWQGDETRDEVGAIRSVHMLPGTREQDVVEVHGELIISRPVGLAALELGPADVGKVRSVAGAARVTLTRLDAREAALEIELQGGASVASVVARTGDGRVLPPQSRLRSGTHHEVAFREPIAGVTVYVQRGAQVQRRAFVLRRGGQAEYSVATRYAGQAPPRGAAGRKGIDSMNTDELAEAAYQAYMAGRYGEAIPYLDRLVSQNPYYAWGYYLRGQSYWRLGRKELAYRDVGIACDRGYKDACALRR